DAPFNGLPTVPPLIELICTIHALSPRAGGAGVADINLKSKIPATPFFSSPTTNVSVPVAFEQSTFSGGWSAPQAAKPKTSSTERMVHLRMISVRLLDPSGLRETPSLTPPN